MFQDQSSKPTECPGTQSISITADTTCFISHTKSLTQSVIPTQSRCNPEIPPQLLDKTAGEYRTRRAASSVPLHQGRIITQPSHRDCNHQAPLSPCTTRPRDYHPSLPAYQHPHHKNNRTQRPVIPQPKQATPSPNTIEPATILNPTAIPAQSWNPIAIGARDGRGI